MEQKLNLKQILALESALEHYFLNELGIEGPKVVDGKWTDIEKVYTWNNSQECRKNVLKLTGAKDIREASKKLQDLKDEVLKGAEAPRSTDQTLPQDLEEKIKEEEIRSEKLKKTRDEAKADVDTATKRQQELQAEAEKLKQKIEELKKEEIVKELKDKKIYAKVEVAEKDKPVLSNTDREKLTKDISEAKTVPRSKMEKVAVEIEESTSQALQKQGLNEKEIKTISLQVASEVVEKLTNINSPEYVHSSYQTAILAAVANDKTIADKIISKADVANNIRLASGNVAVFKIYSDELSREILKTTFGENITKVILGVEPEKVKVTLSETPSAEFTQVVKLDTVHQSNISILESQSDILNQVAGFGKDKIKDQVFSNFSNYIQTRIKSLPEGSALKRISQTSYAQTLFARYGGGTQFVMQPNFVISRLALQVSPELAPVISLFGGGSIGAIMASSTAATYTSIQVTGGIMAAEAFAGGAGGAAAGAAAGSVAPVIGTVIGAVVGYVGGEVVAKGISRLKVLWTENKDKIAPFLAVGVGLSLARFGMGPALLGGAGTFALFGGSVAGLGYGIWRFFGIIGRSVGIAVATPVIVTLLVLPPLVAFIMLVINNSAYVVPPSLLGLNQGGVIVSPYIDVVKTANPPGPFENSELPLTITYTITIRAKKGPLTNVNIEYDCRVVKENASVICPEPNGTIPTTVDNGIQPGSPFVFSYSQTYNSLNYQDTFVTDTITVTADEPSQNGVQAAGAATIKIGDPPEECPTEELWPVNSGYITQGAYTNSSHSGTEAIDIGTSSTNAYTTHSGVVVFSGFDSCYGNEIKIKSSCNGKEFISRYSHLEARGVTVGASVSTGQIIGKTGNTGTCTTGPHLHYEFRYWPDGKPSWPDNAPFMMRPYIPRDVPRGCVTSTSCNVAI